MIQNLGLQARPVVHLNNEGGRIVTGMMWGHTDRKLTNRRPKGLMHARRDDRQQDDLVRRVSLSQGRHIRQEFNEGEEIAVAYHDGTPNGKTFTRHWTIKRKDGRPLIISVIYDVFDAGRGAEYEFVQITTPPNGLIAKITDRMVLLLDEKDLDLWLGEMRAPIEDVKALIKTYEFDPDEWDISIEDPTK